MRKSIFSILVICVVFALCIAPVTNATTYVFGEDGLIKDLTNYSSSWTSLDTYIIAGDCYVDDDDTLTIGAGVNVQFDYDYGGDTGTPIYPTITVKGTIICNGTSGSHVTFTNYSGKTKGEFEGLYINGEELPLVYDYEGVVKGTYTDFFYGGYSNGLIRVGEDGVFDMDYAVIRHSDNHGIYTESTGSTVTMDYCSIDSCDQDGVSWSENTAHDGVVNVDYCTFVDNDSAAMNLPPMRDEVVSITNQYFQRNGWAIILHDGENHGTISNNFFEGGEVGIAIASGVYCDENQKLEIHNNAFVNQNSNCIIITDIAYANPADSDDSLVVEIYNNVFWDQTGNGINFGGYASDSDVWPTTIFDVQHNIFDDFAAPDDAMLSRDAIVGVPKIPSTNAFVTNDDNEGNINDVNCIVEGGGVTITLVDEIGNGEADDYDFHIQYDGNNDLINVAGGAADPDGSDTDVGCFGGPLADDFDFDDLTGWEDYIAIPNDNPYNFADNDVILFDTYRAFGDLQIASGETVTINAGATISFASGKEIDCSGTLLAQGAAEATRITLTATDPANDWAGIDLHTGVDAEDSKFDFCNISEAVNGIAIDSSLTLINNGNAAPIRKCNFSNCSTNGIWLDYNKTWIGDFTSNAGANTFTNCQNGVRIYGGDNGDAMVNHSTFTGGNIGVKLLYSNATVYKCDFTDCEGDAINTLYGNSYSLQQLTIEGDKTDDPSGLFLLLDGDEAEFQKSSINDCDFAIESWGATVAVYEDSIGSVTGNNIGLNCFSSGALDLSGANNKVAICNSADAEIQVDGVYIPELDKGDNDFWNDTGAPFINCTVAWVSGGDTLARENWWDDIQVDFDQDSLDSRFVHTGGEIPMNFGTINDSAQTEPGKARQASFDDVMAAYQLARSYHRNGDYGDADDIYREIIEDHPAHFYARNSLNHVFSIGINHGDDISAVVRYLQSCARRDGGAGFSRHANDMAAFAMVRGGDHEGALEYYEGIINDAPCYRDSVYAVINAGLAYYDAFLHLERRNRGHGGDAVGGGGTFTIAQTPLFGSIAALRPSTESQMYVKMKSLMRSVTDMGGLAAVSPALPGEFILYQNFPNPFNNRSTVNFNIPKSGDVKLVLYDIQGREAMMINDGSLPAGSHNMTFNASNLSTGAYFLKLDANGETQTVSTILMK